MLSARNVILAVVATLTISISINALSMLGPPDSNGAAADSYGTRSDGLRAVFELLHEFGVPVDRRIEPPTAELSTSATVVLWMPHDDLIANEPAYLERMLPWIERGGRLVVSLMPLSNDKATRSIQKAMRRDLDAVWSTLKIDGIRIVKVLLHEAEDPAAPVKNPAPSPSPNPERQAEVRHAIEEIFGIKSIPFTTVDATATGSFDGLIGSLTKLRVPDDDAEDLKIADPASASGTIKCQFPDGASWTVAAAFPRGQGEIVVITEPTLFTNETLPLDDNSVLAFHLLSRGGRPVVFDEFYHGLSIRGNPLWLLTKGTYALTLLTIVMLLGVVLWRRAIMLGPPLDSTNQTRRTIVEYIEAMARFLNQAKGSRLFLLREIRDGAVWITADRLGLSASNHDAELIAAKMAKRSPRDAEQFRQAIELLDQSLAKGNTLNETEAVRALQRISRCL